MRIRKTEWDLDKICKLDAALYLLWSENAYHWSKYANNDNRDDRLYNGTNRRRREEHYLYMKMACDALNDVHMFDGNFIDTDFVLLTTNQIFWINDLRLELLD